MSLGAYMGSALFRQYFVKAQASVMSSLEIQRLSPSSMLDARLLSDSLLEVKSLELVRAASEPMGIKPTWSPKSVFEHIKDEREARISILQMVLIWNTQISFKQESLRVGAEITEMCH